MRLAASSLTSIAILTGLLAAPALLAAGSLNGDELKKLIVGNTAHGTAPNGTAMKNYFDPNGTLVRSVGGKVTEGSYMIAGDGTQCIKTGGTDNCGKIAANGDGTYHRINAEGKILLKWDKIVPGKDIP